MQPHCGKFILFFAGFFIAITTMVFVILIYSLIKCRTSKNPKAAHFHERLVVEIFWATIPFLILVVLATPAAIVLAHVCDSEEAVFITHRQNNK